MSDGMCSIDGCDRIMARRRWCNGHYLRWRRHGDPLGGSQRLPPAVGRGCQVEGCGEPHDSHGYCIKHAIRWRRYGDTSTVNPTPGNRGPRPKGADSCKWGGDAITVSGLHLRLIRERGRAAEHQCAHADGTCKGLMEWANVSQEYRNTADFMPLCRSHHRRYDATFRRCDNPNLGEA
jgi:hypothetical protein